MHGPNVRDNDKKPAITKTAKAKAIAGAQASLPVSVTRAGGRYTTAAYVDGSWTIESNSGSYRQSLELRGRADHRRAVRGRRRRFRRPHGYVRSFQHASVAAGLPVVQRHGTDARDGYEASIQRALDALAVRAAADGFAARTLQLRLLAMIRGKYFEVALPTPGRDGGLGSDQLLAMDGDWLVA